MADSTRKYFPSRWLILAASLVLLMFSGMGYAFALIGETLKDRLDLTQTQVDTIQTIGDFGSNTVGIAAGLFCNRYGPYKSTWIGVVLTSIGYILLTGITTQAVALKSFASVFLSYFLFRFGMSFYSNVSIPLLAQNFPIKDRGKIIGLGKGYIGIGSAFIASFKSDLANDDVDIFMMITMIFIPVASFISAWFIALLPPELASKYLPNEIKTIKYGNDKRCGLSIALWYIVVFVFAIYSVVLSMVQTMYSLGVHLRYALFAVVIVLWLFPWILALFFHGDRRINYQNLRQHTEQLNVNRPSDPLSDDQPEVGMPDIFRYWQLYTLFTVTAIITGAASCFTNNIPQIIESASSDAVHDNENSNISTSLVAIFSFGNFFGRICGGCVTDYFPSLHCSFWLIVPCIMSAVNYSILFVSGGTLWILQIGGVLSGTSMGWVFSAVVVNCSDLWGTKYLAGNFALFNSATTLGNVLFSMLIFAVIYDDFAEMQQDRIHYFKGTKCYGSDCYKWTFLICAGASFVALILSVLQWKYTPKKKGPVAH